MHAIILLALQAGLGDPTIETDHPLYPGEGALQSIEQVVARATSGKIDPQDKAIALFLWQLTHQWHLYSPQEWNVPGIIPGAQQNNYDMVVYDANRSRFSYGYGLCGTVHAWNEPYWKALGMNARRRAFPGHVNSEVEYQGSWHAFDTDMAGLVFRKDGVVAGYDDIAKDPSIVDNDRSPIPRYPFAWPGDFKVMKEGWNQVAKGGKWYSMYNSGYAAQPGIVHLRPGETFTRTFDPDHFGGPSKRRFWHNLKGGPSRDWTFANMGEPEHRGAKSNSRGNATYGNAEFVYRPRLEGWPCFDHFSPYVICGDPQDDTNPMTGPATGGLVVSGRLSGPVTLRILPVPGGVPQDAGEVNGAFEKDLTEFVKGRYGWRIEFAGPRPKVEELTFTTVGQMAQGIYPRLKPGGSRVTCRIASRGVIPVLPDFSLPEAEAVQWEARDLRSANVAYTGDGPKSRFGYTVQGNKPGYVVLSATAPSDLLSVTAAGRFNVPVPPPENCDFRMESSDDGGKTWKPLAKAEIPRDNEYSSGWMYGTTDVKGRKALVRIHLFTGGRPAGLMAAEIYAIYRTPPPLPSKITYAWKEGAERKSHVESLPARPEHSFIVPTGREIKDDFIRIEVP